MCAHHSTQSPLLLCLYALLGVTPRRSWDMTGGPRQHHPRSIAIIQHNGGSRGTKSIITSRKNPGRRRRLPRQPTNSFDRLTRKWLGDDDGHCTRPLILPVAVTEATETPGWPLPGQRKCLITEHYAAMAANAA